MASRAISGKPGGGKSYYSVKLLLEELLESERHIVTNLELDEAGIVAYLERAGRSDIDVYSRITRLDVPKKDEARKVADFWRYRGGGLVLPSISDEAIKAGQRPDIESFGDPVHYFLDELHKFINSRQWASTGPLLLWYISQHRHFGDDVTWITQHVPNVDKQWRSVTQDYTYVRNFGYEKFRGFKKGKDFKALTYLEPFTGSQIPQEETTLQPDWKGIGSCYFTSVSHGKADKGKKLKGLPIWILYICIVAVAVAVALVFIYGPNFASKLLQGKSKDKQSEQVLSSRSASFPASVGNKLNPGSAPLKTPDLVKDDIFNVGVPLISSTAREILDSVGVSAGDVTVCASPFGNGVVVSGPIFQHVVALSERIKLLDREKPETVVLQAVVLRTIKGKGSSVGIWGTLQAVVAANGFNAGSFAFDPVTGLVSMGTVTGAQELIRLLGANDVSRYGFSVESRPVLAACSGQEAWFSAGREVPIPVNTQNINNSQNSVNFKKVLFSLGVKPAVLPNGRIALTISQSNDDVTGSAVISGNSIPVISTQSLSTRIELVEGQVAILGGMRVASRGDESSGFPVLGHVPVLSWFFGNRKKSHEEQELVVAITAFRVPDGQNPVEIRRAEAVEKKISHNGKNARNGFAHK